MDDDLNTAKALGVLFNFVTDTNKRMAEKTLTSGGKEDAKNFLAEAGSILGLLEDGDDIPAEVKEILAERKEARAEKDFAKSDELRDRLAELGFIVKDGRDGQSLVRK
jgi:cysteinyl-tRNA synthetase